MKKRLDRRLEPRARGAAGMDPLCKSNFFKKPVYFFAYGFTVR
jgi:hypothetical protein